MKSRTLAAVLLLLSSPLLLATEYRCVQSEMVRRVQIVYEPGMAVPCEVHYYKDTEIPATHDVLWTAQHESGYCEARTEELIAKLRSYGWNCDETGNVPADDEAAGESDDTEALSPVDEQ